MINFKQVIDKNIFPQKWESHFKEGFKKIIEHSYGDITEDTIFNELWSGLLFMRVALSDAGMIGFYTGRINNVPTGAVILSIAQTYIKEGQPNEVLDELLADIDKIAKKYNCTHITFSTIRESGFARRLKDKGWDKAYVEFVKKVPKEAQDVKT